MLLIHMILFYYNEITTLVTDEPAFVNHRIHKVRGIHHQACKLEDTHTYKIVYFLPSFLREIRKSIIYLIYKQTTTRKKLVKDFELHVSCIINIRGLAMKRLRILEKPKEITLRRRDRTALTNRQIGYGCLDVFASFELRRVLRVSSVFFYGRCNRIDENSLFKKDGKIVQKVINLLHICQFSYKPFNFAN
ncbi:hypothetical protein ACJRO7_003827 [Eucalyptus globulus]|uniref:Uncharacterized protein n=1 Tax=Eucalyptus globulus TaxID=34317 RepID=A0ABD3IXK8_EUCGL